MRNQVAVQTKKVLHAGSILIDAQNTEFKWKLYPCFHEDRLRVFAHEVCVIRNYVQCRGLIRN